MHRQTFARCMPCRSLCTVLKDAVSIHHGSCIILSHEKDTHIAYSIHAVRPRRIRVCRLHAKRVCRVAFHGIVVRRRVERIFVRRVGVPRVRNGCASRFCVGRKCGLGHERRNVHRQGARRALHTPLRPCSFQLRHEDEGPKSRMGEHRGEPLGRPAREEHRRGRLQQRRRHASRCAGREWFECDIDYDGGYRNEKRIVYSDDGLVFYTGDHYKTFEQLY